MIAMEIPLIPRTRRTEKDEAALAASMARHPSGTKQLPRQCPTCGANASGALGETAPVLIS